MTVRVDIDPAMLRWAAQRGRRDLDQLQGSFAKLEDWLTGEARPTLRQLERYAKATRTAIGYFFLPSPPEEELPIADMRTVADREIEGPSADLLDTLYLCERRQDWFRKYLRYEDPDRDLPWVCCLTVEADPMEGAARLRAALVFEMAERRRFRTWTEALRELSRRIEELGALVMINGVVGNNTHRPLDVDEFRGFALSDPVAPLVFVNGKDSKSAQMFTLAHEVAHLWLGQSALSDVPIEGSAHEVERWCNQVAAEMLVPAESLAAEARLGGDLTAELKRLARVYKVSTLVLLRRLHELALLDEAEFWRVYRREEARVVGRTREGGGGNFYATSAQRTSPTFARALVASTLEGETLYTDAMDLLSISKTSTLHELGARMGLGV